MFRNPESAGTALMPPKKKAKTDDRRSLISLKGSGGFAEWLDGLVKHTRLGTRTLVMRNALEDFAKTHGYTVPVPDR